MNKNGGEEAIDWVARARDLAPLVAANADRTEQERQVTDEVMAALHDAALFRVVLPRAMGGGEASPLTVMRVLEAVAMADASTAWCLGQALGCSLAAAFLPPEAARDIFGPPNAVLAWGPPNMKAKAVATDGGYRVTGDWMFASGSRHATWMGAHIPVYEADGSPRKDKGGNQVIRSMMYPRDSVEISDVWRVIGLKGTGSDNYAVNDLFVPEAYTYVRDSFDELYVDSPIYHVPLIPFYGIGFAGVACGIARVTLDAFIDHASRRVPSGSSAAMRENAVIQTGVAEAEARLRTARAYLCEMAEELWQTAATGEALSMDQRARLRIAITYGSNQAREVVDFAYRTAGAAAVFEDNPFERRFRDMHAVSQQGQAHWSNMEAAGAVFLGIEPKGHRI